MRIIKAHEREFNLEIFDKMHRGRAQVFQERLGWPVTVEDGLEVDYYDRHCDPVYIVDLDESGEVAGSLRILPTTGETMIAREFTNYFDEPVDVSHPRMWECTKFCIHGHAAAARATSLRLLIALHNLCTDCGINRILGLYELQMERVYSRLRWKPCRLATSKVGDPKLAVGVWKVDAVSLQQMQQTLERA